MQKSKYNYKISSEFLFYSTIILFFTFLLTLNVVSFDNRVLFQGLVGIDTATSLVKLFILIVSCGCLFISSDYLDKSRLGCFEFFVLYLLCVFGVMFFISSLDLFMLFLALEIQGICFYALVAINRNSGYCAEAGIKYFVLGAFSSGVLLFGISMIYGATGTTNMLSIFHFLQNLDLVLIKDMLYLYSDFSNPIFITNSKLVLGFLFMFIGFLFKVTAAPFHMWAPDIYEGAPFATVVFISTVPKIAVFFMFVKFIGFYFVKIAFLWKSLFILSGIISIIVGTLFAIRQYKTKRFLAYSSITHMGYILLGLSTGTFEGLKFAMVYVVVYVLTLLNIWGLVSIMEHNYGQKIDSILDFGGVFYKNRFIGTSLVITLFSLSGLPPFIGFFAKYFLLSTMVHSSMYILTVLVIFSSLFSIYYYAKIIKIVLFDSKNKFLVITRPANYSLVFTMSLSLLLLFIFYEIPLVQTISESLIQSLFIN
jgi:NADH-quinone oxidoreductase subunit N